MFWAFRRFFDCENRLGFSLFEPETRGASVPGISARRVPPRVGAFVPQRPPLGARPLRVVPAPFGPSRLSGSPLAEFPAPSLGSSAVAAPPAVSFFFSLLAVYWYLGTRSLVVWIWQSSGCPFAASFRTPAAAMQLV